LLINHGDRAAAGRPLMLAPPETNTAGRPVLNYEEGDERCTLHGDHTSEAFLSDVLGAEPWSSQRHMNVEAMYEYGARAGFWLLRRLRYRRPSMPVQKPSGPNRCSAMHSNGVDA
jgi:hypothetical protein